MSSLMWAASYINDYDEGISSTVGPGDCWYLGRVGL